MKALLNRLIQHQQLSREEARQVIIHIAEGKYNTSQIASFLTVYMMRSISLEELHGFREALLELCITIDLSEFNTIDLCGTGGDGKDTFNISTLSSFVTAGADIKEMADATPINQINEHRFDSWDKFAYLKKRY